MSAATAMIAALNRLAKWRVVFAGWQLGTREKGDPEADALRDHREATLILRAEMSALISTLVEKKIISAEEFQLACTIEADVLNESLAKRFPGITAESYGIKLTPEAVETMKGWPQ